ncbi:MAG: LysR family transcriptional regulator [Gammaproteobacteria bacterium]|jgi:DNA-binding transcriptional LysR family regulator|nr:LysR family transcriptional regulator [Gammaproteobacteria bacterium]
MDRFSELEAFVRVADTGSFTAAADQLELAKSAVSRRIAELEARLGVQLFSRSTRRVRLTDTGQGFYEHATGILADLAEAECRASQQHGELAGRLRLALPHSFGLRHMEPAIEAFCSRHPGVRFDLDFSDRRVDLLQEGIDLAIRIGRLEDSSLIARRLFEARTVVCASPEYLATHGTPARPEELADHAGLVYTNLANPDRWSWWDDAGTRHQVQVPVQLSANSGDFLCAAAAAGRGVTVPPTFIAWEYLRRGELVPLLQDFRWPVSPAYAVYPPTRHLSYRVRAFIDFLAERFAGVPYWDDPRQPLPAATSGDPMPAQA